MLIKSSFFFERFCETSFGWKRIEWTLNFDQSGLYRFPQGFIETPLTLETWSVIWQNGAVYDNQSFPAAVNFK